jgi:AcrR family transcriptional regulator
MASTSGTRGSYAKSVERRQDILEAAMEVFAESGFRSGSLRDIADKVGISQAGLLHHFPSKPALLAAVLALRDDRSRRIVPEASTGIDYVRGFLELIRYNATVPGLVELYCVLSAEATAPDHPAHDYFEARYEATVQWLVESFTVMTEQGQLVVGISPVQAARTAVALADGLQVQWLYSPQQLDMADQLRRQLQLFVTVPL